MGRFKALLLCLLALCAPIQAQIPDAADEFAAEAPETKDAATAVKAAMANGTCKGRTEFRRKAHGDDLAGYFGILIGRLTGNDRVAVCEPLRRFVPPSMPLSAVIQAPLPAPPYMSAPSLVQNFALLAFIAGATLPELEPLAAKTQAKASGDTSAVRPSHKLMYMVPLTISRKKAQDLGVVPGVYPANYLENQKKGGLWSKRTRTVAQVAPTSDGGFLCAIYLEREPAKNSAVAVDFRNGNSIHVTSKMLAGVKTYVIVPKLDKKKYADLKNAYRVKRPLLLSLARFLVPAAPQVAMGVASMGTAGMAMPAIGWFNGFAMRKIADNQRSLAAAQNPSLHVDYVLAEQGDKLSTQSTRIATLEFQIESLKKELEAFRRMTKEFAAKTAKSEGRNRQ